MDSLTFFSGNPSPLGFSIHQNKANFALYSQNATHVVLGLFSSNAEVPFQEFAMNRTGDIWHLGVNDLPEGILYAFRCHGVKEEARGHLFNESEWLTDPYAKILDCPLEWGTRKRRYLAVAAEPPKFDWEKVRPPCIPSQDLILYEMHVRGFTQHPSSAVEHPGTFLGILEKIPYLKKLGVNAIELMPIFEFDEIHSKDIQPHTGEPLPNYWGYNTLFFMAPMRRYAADPSLFAPLTELKTLVKELHRNGMEILLDVVFNHTGEGNEKNYFVNFRGIDNRIYYMVDLNGNYRNYTGCGNTFNCNMPIVQEYILDCLKYWVEEVQIDGFRFDLASIFTRGIDGHPIDSPPIVRAITKYCQSKNVKLIAEAWDAAGLYQVGLFPNKWGYWSDWNGKYRDTVRRFIKGTPFYVGAFADAISGSESIYKLSKTPLSSLNFITAHDGYTLRDLVTYQMKHNYENGEMNHDGNNQNDSWNCGAEGPTINPLIAALRERQMRNFLLALFLSQGSPMFLMGDEYGHSRKGNNNPFVQDNEINWFLWNLLQKNEKVFSFVSSLIAFRKTQDSLKSIRFLTSEDIQWHGLHSSSPNWNEPSQFLSFTLKGNPCLFAAFNAHPFEVSISLPKEKSVWRQIVHTDHDWDMHFLNALDAAPIVNESIELPSYSAVLCVEVIQKIDES